jgi:hypothetical protein
VPVTNLPAGGAFHAAAGCRRPLPRCDAPADAGPHSASSLSGVTNGVDANGRAAIEWGVYGVPESFLVGRDGRIAYKLIGPMTPENLDTTLKPEIEKALAATTPSS